MASTPGMTPKPQKLFQHRKKKSWKIPFSTQLFPHGLRGSGGNKKAGIKGNYFSLFNFPPTPAEVFQGKHSRGDE